MEGLAMRRKFSGWYPRDASQLATIWDQAIFVPDANVLLHCLRHPENVRRELVRLFDVLKDSLWIPYQVGLEFHRNRLDVELGALDAYEKLTQEYESSLNQAREKLRQLRAHPVISVERELSALDMFLQDFRARMATAQAEHPREAIAQAVARITDLLEGRVGDKWPPELLSALKKEGEDRYAKKIPPGYKDAKKDAGEFDKFGDLIIWKDLIAKAKAEKRPVIFVSDDAKEDWWWIHRGRKLGPRPELIEEFRICAGQDFHIYEFTQFLRIAADRHPEIKAGVEEVEKSLLYDEKARKRQHDAAHQRELKARIAIIEDEKDQVVAALSGAPSLDSTRISEDRSSLRARLESLNAELSTLSALVEEEVRSRDSNHPRDE
jgi:hypothetical protein